MNATRQMTLDAKSMVLIFAIGLGDLAAEVVTFFGGLASSAGGAVSVLCESVWAVVAFPLGWVGLVSGSTAIWMPDVLTQSAMQAFQRRYLWAGVAANALLWAWIAYRVIRAIRFAPRHDGFDASAVSARISELRKDHAVAAHSRSRPCYAHEGLVGAARQTVRRCAYFLRAESECHESAEEEETKV